jgi:hypothetical protein
MVLTWFDAEAAKTFGTSLAVLFIEKVPVNDSQTVDDKLFARKTKKVLATMATKIAEFRRNNSLNVYKRAQLGNAFKWKLKEAGYSPEYINELTLWLVKQV